MHATARTQLAFWLATFAALCGPATTLARAQDPSAQTTPLPPVSPPVDDARYVAEVTPARRAYAERYFGQGSSQTIEGYERSPSLASQWANRWYAPVEPASPLNPLGGDSPWTLPGTKPATDMAGPPDPATGSMFHGTSWYTGSVDGNHGWDPFEGHSTLLSWGWRHWVSQYMWENFQLFAGPQGFKGPPDLGLNGNFGFHEGLNWSMPVWDAIGLGYQKGFQVVESDYSGGSGAVNHSRVQTFVTAGLFHRPVTGSGLQCGAAIDYLNDSFYADVNLTQIRSEVSYVDPCGHEIGFWSAVHLDTNVSGSPIGGPSIVWFGTDLYAGFYRLRLASGGNVRIWGGAASGSDGLVGGDGMMPITERWAVQGAFNYKISNLNAQNALMPVPASEAFAVTMNLIWFPGYRTPVSVFNPYRPLFNVADNTTFLVNAR